jgi:hypothetical protein
MADADATTFSDLGQVGPVRFQGGIIWLEGHGCRRCGHGFWTEADRDRRLEAGSSHPCPHCGEVSTTTAGNVARVHR